MQAKPKADEQPQRKVVRNSFSGLDEDIVIAPRDGSALEAADRTLAELAASGNSLSASSSGPTSDDGVMLAANGSTKGLLAGDSSAETATRDYFRKLAAEDVEWKLNYGPASRDGYFAAPDSSGIDFGFGALSGGLFSLTAEPVMGLLGIGDSLIGGLGYELGIENNYTFSRSQQLSDIGSAIGGFFEHPLDSTAGFFSSRWDGMQEAWSNRELNPGSAGVSFGRNAGEIGGTVFAAGALSRSVGHAGFGVCRDIRSLDGGLDFDISYIGRGLATNAEAGLTFGRYGDIRGTLAGRSQAHHLNQDAAFGSVIPRDDGFAIRMRGNAFTKPGTPHYDFHSSLENFWENYRVGGSLFGETPTNAAYGAAIRQAMVDSGYSVRQADALHEGLHRTGQISACQRPSPCLGFRGE